MKDIIDLVVKATGIKHVTAGAHITWEADNWYENYEVSLYGEGFSIQVIDDTARDAADAVIKKFNERPATCLKVIHCELDVLKKMGYQFGEVSNIRVVGGIYTFPDNHVIDIAIALMKGKATKNPLTIMKDAAYQLGISEREMWDIQAGWESGCLGNEFITVGARLHNDFHR